MIITRNAVFLFWHLSFIVSTSKNASTREISKPTAAKQQRQGLRTGNNFPSASLASVVTCIATNAPIPLCLTVKDSRNKVKKERRKLRKTPDPFFFLPTTTGRIQHLPKWRNRPWIASFRSCWRRRTAAESKTCSSHPACQTEQQD